MGTRIVYRFCSSVLMRGLPLFFGLSIGLLLQLVLDAYQCGRVDLPVVFPGDFETECCLGRGEKLAHGEIFSDAGVDFVESHAIHSAGAVAHASNSTESLEDVIAIILGEFLADAVEFRAGSSVRGGLVAGGNGGQKLFVHSGFNDPLLFDQSVRHFGIQGAGQDEVLHKHGVPLTDAVAAVLRLGHIAGNPIEFRENHMRRGGEGDPHSRGGDRTHKQGAGFVVLESLNGGIPGILRVSAHEGNTGITEFGSDCSKHVAVMSKNDDFRFRFQCLFDVVDNRRGFCQSGFVSHSGELGECNLRGGLEFRHSLFVRLNGIRFGEFCSGLEVLDPCSGFGLSPLFVGDGAIHCTGGGVDRDDLADFWGELFEDLGFQPADHNGRSESFLEFGEVFCSREIPPPSVPLGIAVGFHVAPERSGVPCFRVEGRNQSPEVLWAVHDGGPGEPDSAFGGDCEGGLRSLRAMVFAIVHFVVDYEVPRPVVGRAGRVLLFATGSALVCDDVVIGDYDVGVRDVGSLGDADGILPNQPCVHFVRPIAFERRRTNDEDGFHGLIDVDEPDCLDGFPQPHFIGEEGVGSRKKILDSGFLVRQVFQPVRVREIDVSVRRAGLGYRLLAVLCGLSEASAGAVSAIDKSGGLVDVVGPPDAEDWIPPEPGGFGCFFLAKRGLQVPNRGAGV